MFKKYNWHFGNEFPFSFEIQRHPKAQLKHLNSGTRKKSGLDFEDSQSGAIAGCLVFYWPPLQPDSLYLPHLLSRDILLNSKISEDEQPIS